MARELLVKAKAKKDEQKAATQAAKRAAPVDAPIPISPVATLIAAAHELEAGDKEIDEILAEFPDDKVQAIETALPTHWLADSHAKGAKYQNESLAAKLRALTAQRAGFIDNAAFIVGALGLVLNVRNYLVEAREIARIAEAD